MSISMFTPSDLSLIHRLVKIELATIPVQVIREIEPPMGYTAQLGRIGFLLEREMIAREEERKKKLAADQKPLPGAAPTPAVPPADGTVNPLAHEGSK